MTEVTTTQPFEKQSLFYAPMEGITDEAYRLSVEKHFPEWDYIATSFLRVPSNGVYSKSFITKFFGEKSISCPKLREKTLFQILTCEKANLTQTVETIGELGFPWLDLNLGCPSKTVNRHGGGSYLLSDLKALEKIIVTIRKIWPQTFTAKIRVGYQDDTNFQAILSLLEAAGVDAITIHARTRNQMYKGIANWDYLREASKLCQVPVVGNGDIWDFEDILKLFQSSNCHSAMLARGALKTPWMASLYKEYTRSGKKWSKEEIVKMRFQKAYPFLKTFQENLLESGFAPPQALKRCKAITHYLFLDEMFSQLKRSLLRSQSFEEFNDQLLKLRELEEEAGLAIGA